MINILEKFNNLNDYLLFRAWVLQIYSCSADSLPDDVLNEAIDEFNFNYLLFNKFFCKGVISYE